MTRASPRRRLHGMTLVELMVGLAVGLFVSLIAISVFVSTRTLNTVNNAGVRMSENARLAMEVLQDDLRQAGFQGCHDVAADPPVSALNAAAAAAAGFLDTDITTGVAGHRGTGSSFAPALGTALQALTVAPNANSDILTVRVPTDSLSLGLVATMATLSAAPRIGVGSALSQGDIVLLADCKAGEIFQITEADPAATGSLAHAAGAGLTPGNATGNLQQRFGPEASVYRLETRHYYVAPSVLHPGANALWRFRVPCVGCAANANPQELASGIDRLSVSWGVDTDASADQTVNRYLGSDAVGAAALWSRVVVARLQMLVSTPEDNVTQRAQTVTFAGNAVTATDRRLRTALTQVVALRNRVP